MERGIDIDKSREKARERDTGREIQGERERERERQRETYCINEELDMSVGHACWHIQHRCCREPACVCVRRVCV